MPLNEVTPFYESADRLTYQATAPVTGGRFIAPSGDRVSGPGIPATAQIGASDPVDGGNYRGAHATAAGPASGVSTWDAGIGEKFGGIREGVIPMTADGPLVAGAAVEVGALGKPKARTAGLMVGVVMSGAVDGATAEILLTI